MGGESSLARLFRVLRGKGLKVLYGPPLSCKTSLAISFLRHVPPGYRVYVGLGKHCSVARMLSGSASSKCILDFRDEVRFLAEELPGLQEGAFLLYDGFGATLLPLRSVLKESAVARAALFVASSLKMMVRMRAASIVIVTTETARGRPIMYRSLRDLTDVFIHVRRVGDAVSVSLRDANLAEIGVMTIPLEEILTRCSLLGPR